MLSAREIPGFYYGLVIECGRRLIVDAEKRKYFKIDPHGQLSNPYSRDNVRKRQLHEQEKCQEKKAKYIREMRYRTSKVLERWTIPLRVQGYLNRRELGLQQPGQTQRMLELKQMTLIFSYHVGPAVQEDSTYYNISSFVLDDELGVALYGVSGGIVTACLWHHLIFPEKD